MRALIFSDPHITAKAEFSSPTDDGLSEYLHRVIKSFEWIEQLVTDHTPDFVAMLGDLFETTGFVETASLKVATKVCQSLANVCCACDIPLFWLAGNHDIYSAKNRVHNLEFLKLGWGEVIDKPTLMKNGVVFFQPYTEEYPITFPEDAKVVLAHLAVSGAKLNSVKRSDTGLDVDSTQGKRIFNGHHHTREDVYSTVMNIGSLLSRNFTDVDSGAKGATIVTVNGYDISSTFHVNPHDVQFKDVEIKTEKQALSWQSRVEDCTTGLEDAFVRVKYEPEFEEVAEQISCFAKGAKREELQRVVSFNEDHVSETFSPEENFKQYLDGVLIFDDDTDRERILTKGLAYLKQVQQDQDRQHTLPIRFKWMRVRDFQCLGSMTVQFDDQGLVWCEGINLDDPADSNGSGKSTVPEALYWCITGKSLREYTGDDVISWYADSCEVETCADIGNTEYRVTRSRHPNKVRLVKDGVEIDLRRSKDVNKLLAELIGRPKDVLQHSIFLTADLKTRFTALSYPDRIRLLEQITGASVYSDVEKLVKADHTKAQSDFALYTGAIRATETVIKDLTERMQAVNGQYLAAKREQVNKLSELKSDLRKKLDRVQHLTTEVEALKEDRDHLTEEESIAYQAIDTAKKAGQKVGNAVASMDGELKSLEHRCKTDMKLAEQGTCPTCGTEGIGHEGSALGRRIQLARMDLKAKTDNRKAVADKFDRIAEVIRRKVMEHEKVNKKLRALTAELQTKDGELRSTEFSVGQMKEHLKDARNETAELEVRRDEVKRSLLEAKQRLENDVSRQAEFEREVYALEWLTDAFSTKGIRARVLNTVTVPFLNSRLEKHSAVMGFPTQLTTQVETKGGKKEDKIDPVLTGQRTYKGCSRGEKRKVDLSIQTAINDLSIATGGSKVNLLIADEVIDPLDDQGVCAFIDILQEKSQTSTVLLMTHKPFIDSFAGKRWSLVKSDGVTKLEVN